MNVESTSNQVNFFLPKSTYTFSYLSLCLQMWKFDISSNWRDKIPGKGIRKLIRKLIRNRKKHTHKSNWIQSNLKKIEFSTLKLFIASSRISKNCVIEGSNRIFTGGRILLALSNSTHSEKPSPRRVIVICSILGVRW